MLYHAVPTRQDGYFYTKLSCSIGAATIVLGRRLPTTASSADTEILVQSNGGWRDHTDTVWCVSCDLDQRSPSWESWGQGSRRWHTVIERHPCQLLHLGRH